MSEIEAVATGLALSALTLAPRAAPLLIDLNHTLYHQKYSITTVALGLLLGVVFLGIAYSIAVLGLSRLPDGQLKRLAIAVSIFGAIQLSGHVLLRVMGATYLARILHWSAYTVLVVLVIVAVRSAARFHAIITRFRFLLTGGAIFAVVVAGQLARAAIVSYRVSHRQPPPGAAAFPQTSTSHRVIWIIFDELSYEQVFGSRSAAGLRLPYFEALQHVSVSFRNVMPAGNWTEEAVPSLFLGSVVTHVIPVTPRKVLIRLAGTMTDVPFDPNATIFGTLRAARMNSAIVGWFNPYCDLLAPVLTSCMWESDVPVLPETTSERLSGNQTVVENSLAILSHQLGVLRRLVDRRRGGVASDVVERKRSYDALVSAAICAIDDSTASLLFIHLPVPHPPGFYSRRLQAFSSSGTYLDNLALADLTLDVLLKTIANSSTADVTAVIVTTDHSWRIGLWKNDPRWSSEEASVSVSGFDPHIPLLVHFPGQREQLDIDTPFEAIRTRSLIELILRGTLSAPDSVRTWAQRR